MGVPLYIICCCCFSLVVFYILSLSLIFVILIIICLCVFLLGFILPGSLHFLDLVGYLLSHVWEVFSYYLFKCFLMSFISLFSFWDPYNANIDTFNVVPEVSLDVFFFIFSIFYSVAVISTILSFRSLFHSSASVILLLIPSSVLFISVCSLVLLGLW